MAQSSGSGAGLELPRFERQPNLTERVTGYLMDRVMHGALRPGDRLPAERELAERLNVSRTVVREAIRSLQARGVLRVRGGSGMEVMSISPERASEALRLFVQLSEGVDQISYDHINDVRQMIEIRVAGIAARTAGEPELARLQEIHRELVEAVAGDDLERASVADVAFHRELAQATHNLLYVVMLDSIGDVLLDIRRRTLGVEGRQQIAVHTHAEILEQIARHDPDGAQRAMSRHLDDSLAIWNQLSA